MKYWEDMQSKFGFGDGDVMPDGVEVHRTLYIQTVNKLATQLNSKQRIVAYNRAGLHNSCLILIHELEDLKNISVEQYHKHVSIDVRPAQADDIMEDAIWQAHELCLDDYVHITVEIDSDFDEFLDTLNAEKEV